MKNRERNERAKWINWKGTEKEMKDKGEISETKRRKKWKRKVKERNKWKAQGKK